MPTHKLSPIARRAIVRAVARRHGVDPGPETLAVNLTVERFDDEMVLAELPALLERARELGVDAPIALLGAKEPYCGVLVSGDHIWRLADRVEDLVAALDVLAEKAVTGATTCGHCARAGILR